jgi:hypothetical protein
MGFNERRIMKNLYWFLLLLLAFPLLASAQSLEVSGGYAHISGDGGVDGFNVGAAAWVSRRVSLAFDYDSAWDNSHLGAFELTQTGLIVTKSEVNQTLSEQRASTVRDYLVNQGLNAGSLSAQGLGTNNPVGDNGTAEGRQKNRRVEIIVSGEVIGTQVGH